MNARADLPPGPPRRAVLGAGGVLAGGALAGCGAGGSGAGGSDSTDSAAVSGATVPLPAVGEPVYDSSLGTIVSQPSEGTVVAFDSTCPHQGCAVSEVSSTALECPCHGSVFDPATGEVVRGPATTGLTTRTATLRAGVVELGG